MTPISDIQWHGSDRDDLTLKTVKPGLHVGTRTQAEMRWPGRHLYRIEIATGCRTIRLRDTGGWSDKRLRAAAKRAPVAVYLNRYEGLPLDAINAAAENDNAPDYQFRKKVAGAEDSAIIFDIDVIRCVERVI
ncbi:MAG: hypothetical protein CL949_14090 [Erythrobacter sp.]|nr:hypothetical protein [Erythrobacter sp.]